MWKNNMTYQQDLKKVMILYPDLEVQSSQDYKDLINIHNILESVLKKEPDYKIVEAAFNDRNSIPLNTANDYFFLVFKSALNNHELKKIAYPNMVGYQDLNTEFDIEKWAGLVHKIYDAVNSGDMNLESAIDYYAGTLDTEASEDENFKQWIKYYQNGEHLKYSELQNEIKKQSFQFPLSSPGFYGPDNAVIPPDVDRSFHKLKQESDKKDSYSEWRNKLYSAIRRIDKLLRNGDDYMDIDTQRDLADLLHHFDQEVRTLRLESTASDLAYKYANRFKKMGFDEGYKEFIKQAQELEIPDELQPGNEGGAAGLEGDADEIQPQSGDPNQTAIERSLSQGSDAEQGEYNQLDGNVNLGDAVAKLEEIAGRLSGRRTIRLLAEFDIMLDKIGIASMFPELAEAQSKLIDGYSYALTRVTKMLGMLSSGKSLVEISDAKKKDLNDKAMKEVNKTLEGGETESGAERGAEAIQQGLEETQQPATQPQAQTPNATPEEPVV